MKADLMVGEYYNEAPLPPMKPGTIFGGNA
jgi:hypothetical protein